MSARTGASRDCSRPTRLRSICLSSRHAFLRSRPWRLQYFEGVACPRDVRIPTEDPDGYQWNPGQRRIYNKLFVAESQGLACAPHGVTPA